MKKLEATSQEIYKQIALDKFQDKMRFFFPFLKRHTLICPILSNYKIQSTIFDHVIFHHIMTLK